jgi:amino acid transporter
MTSSAPAVESTTLAKDRLGIPAVLYFILSAMAPMTVVAGVVTTMYAVTGLSAIGAAFVAVALVLAVFAVGYVAMARYITNAGALYAYISRGLGRPVGVGAALVAAVAYNLLQVGLYGMFGPTLAGCLADKAGLDLPRGAGGRRARRPRLRRPADQPVGGRPVRPSRRGRVAGDGAARLRGLRGRGRLQRGDQGPAPHRAGRRVQLALIGAAYALSSWAMSVHYGDDQVAAVAAQQGPGMLFAMASPAVAEIATVLFMTSLLAAMISFHNAVARCMFALGRERVLPAALGRTEPRTGAPRIASLTQSTVGLAVIVLYALPARRAPGSTEAWALPASFAVAAVLGVLYGLWLRSARPDVYQGIGLGADALTAG